MEWCNNVLDDTEATIIHVDAQISEEIIDIIKYETNLYEDYIISLEDRGGNFVDDYGILENKEYHELKPVSFETAENLLRRQEMTFKQERINGSGSEPFCEICCEHFIDEDTLRTHIEDWHESTDRDSSDSNSYRLESIDDDSNSQMYLSDSKLKGSSSTSSEIIEVREDASLEHATKLLHKLVANFSKYKISDFEYQCPLCDLKFQRRTSLLSHLNEHVYNMEDEFDRDVMIGKSKTVGKKKFTCEHCVKSFHTMLLLKRHMFTHDSDRQYACKICSMKYKTKQILAIHTQTHTRPFSCQHCKKTFSQKGNLNSHLRRNHCTKLKDSH